MRYAQWDPGVTVIGMPGGHGAFPSSFRSFTELQPAQGLTRDVQGHVLL
jgi:hypothetical protein